MRILFLVLGLALLSFGCLFQPYSEDVNLSKKSGCAYNDPACEINQSCINNTCILKQGCDYSNPACQQNETCKNNTCFLKSGCDYNNPSCVADYECVDNTCIEEILCGKFGCQTGEVNCCQDCGCAQGSICYESGLCLVNGSDVEIINLTISPIPSTVLYAVPPKTIEKKLGPLAQVELLSVGNLNAYAVKIKSEVSWYSDATIHELGILNSKETMSYNITQRLKDQVLKLENGPSAKLKLTLEYKGAGETHTKTSGTNILLSDRNAFDWDLPEAAAAWVDPTDQSIIDFSDDATLNAEIGDNEDRERAARQIFNHLQAFGLKHSGAADICYSDSLKFPAETLRDKSGDCAELSVLFAALLEAAGVQSVIIKTDGVVMPGYQKADGSVVAVDLRNIQNSDYDEATAKAMSEYNKDSFTVYTQKEWNSGMERANIGLTVLSPKITTTSANCILYPEEFKVNYWFENHGFDNGRRCLKSVLYDGQTEYFSKRVCVDIPKFEKRNVTFVLDVAKNTAFTEKCWLD
jgi:hypothetical protein